MIKKLFGFIILISVGLCTYAGVSGSIDISSSATTQIYASPGKNTDMHIKGTTVNVSSNSSYAHGIIHLSDTKTKKACEVHVQFHKKTSSGKIPFVKQNTTFINESGKRYCILENSATSSNVWTNFFKTRFRANLVPNKF